MDPTGQGLDKGPGSGPPGPWDQGPVPGPDGTGRAKGPGRPGHLGREEENIQPPVSENRIFFEIKDGSVRMPRIDPSRRDDIKASGIPCGSF